MEYKLKFSSEEEKEKLIKENSNLTLIKVAYLLGENYLVFTDEEIEYELTENEILGNKISILEAENEKLKVEQKQQNEDILMNMLATTEMYELNKAYSISTLGVKTDKKVPVHIQATYQKLYELGLKEISEMPFEVRINLKAK